MDFSSSEFCATVSQYPAAGWSAETVRGVVGVARKQQGRALWQIGSVLPFGVEKAKSVHDEFVLFLHVLADTRKSYRWIRLTGSVGDIVLLCRRGLVIARHGGHAKDVATHPIFLIRWQAHEPVFAIPRGIPMKNFGTKIKRFLASEDGPTAVEYAVMLALIIVVCLTTITTLGSTANARFSQVNDAIDN